MRTPRLVMHRNADGNEVSSEYASGMHDEDKFLYKRGLIQRGDSEGGQTNDFARDPLDLDVKGCHL